MIEDGPKPAMQTTRKLAANAPVNLVIYKVTDFAGDVWERYKGTQEPLWQIQLSQDSARPITYQMRDRFSDFLRSSNTFLRKAPSKALTAPFLTPGTLP